LIVILDDLLKIGFEVILFKSIKWADIALLPCLQLLILKIKLAIYAYYDDPFNEAVELIIKEKQLLFLIDLR